MRENYLLFAIILLFTSCQKENINNTENESQQFQNNNKTYYVIMKITLENQRAKLINEQFERFNKEKLETMENFVSDVKEVTRENPIDEDSKYRMLDIFEKQLLNQVKYDAIVVNRNFEIYNSYSEASQNR